MGPTILSLIQDGRQWRALLQRMKPEERKVIARILQRPAPVALS